MSTHFVTAHICEPLGPLFRGEVYEEPLQQKLDVGKLGEVVGGGTALNDNGEIEGFDIELELTNLDSAVAAARDALEDLGAPRGSELQFERDGQLETLSFGNRELLGIYLDGQTLPDDVYETSDINELAEAIVLAIRDAGAGELRSDWQGPTETALYLSGRSSEQLETIVEPILLAFPLGQNARLVRNWGASSAMTEKRLPRRSS